MGCGCGRMPPQSGATTSPVIQQPKSAAQESPRLSPRADAYRAEQPPAPAPPLPGAAPPLCEWKGASNGAPNGSKSMADRPHDDSSGCPSNASTNPPDRQAEPFPSPTQSSPTSNGLQFGPATTQPNGQSNGLVNGHYKPTSSTALERTEEESVASVASVFSDFDDTPSYPVKAWKDDEDTGTDEDRTVVRRRKRANTELPAGRGAQRATIDIGVGATLHHLHALRRFSSMALNPVNVGRRALSLKDESDEIKGEDLNSAISIANLAKRWTIEDFIRDIKPHEESMLHGVNDVDFVQDPDAPYFLASTVDVNETTVKRLRGIALSYGGGARDKTPDMRRVTVSSLPCGVLPAISGYHSTVIPLLRRIRGRRMSEPGDLVRSESSPFLEGQLETSNSEAPSPAWTATSADSPKSSEARATKPLIIFDWDDTLFPTTWGHGQPDGHPHFRECAAVALRVLREAHAVGTVAIVTLAREGWVQDCCERIQDGGELWRAIAEHVDSVQYARTAAIQQNHMDQLPPWPRGAEPRGSLPLGCWLTSQAAVEEFRAQLVASKLEAMRVAAGWQTPVAYGGEVEHGLSQIVSVGDSPIERQAAHELPFLEEDRLVAAPWLTKTLLVEVADDPELKRCKSVLGCLEAVERLLPRVVDSPIDIDLNVDPTKPMWLNDMLLILLDANRAKRRIKKKQQQQGRKTVTGQLADLPSPVRAKSTWNL